MKENKNISPPKLALKFIEWFCPDELQETIIGDLYEQFEINLERNGPSRSKWLFTYNTVRFFRYGILSRKAKRQHSNSIAMFRNYFKTSVRNLIKQKFYFLLNTIGLSIGIAACLLCYLHLSYELSYDQHIPYLDRNFRLVTGDVNSGEGWVRVSAPMPDRLKEEIPEIVDYARMTNITRDPKVSVAHENVIFSEEKFFLVDPAFLDIFGIPLLRGEANEVLEDLNSVIISESTAAKYFREENPVGKILRVNDQNDFVITGVFEDIPFNTHYDADFFISFKNLERVLPNTSLTANWGQFNYLAYLQLAPGADPSLVQQKIQSTEINIGTNRNFDLSSIAIQPVSDIHFVANPGNLKPAYNFNYIYIYAAIAFAILFISFINFVNLTIANSSKRLKEVGVREVVGANKIQLVLQFVIESLLVALTAAIVALVFCQYLFVPAINDLLNSRIALNLFDPLLVAVLMGLLLLIAISSGGYIAYFIISSKPVNILKGNATSGKKGSLFKNVLLGIQLSISTILILSSLFIYQQLNFLGGKDIGFSKDQVVSVSLSSKTAQESGDLIASRFEQVSGVRSVSGSDFTPGAANWNNNVWWEGQVEDVSFFLITVDPKFISTMELELIEGDLETIESSKATQVVLNEAARDYIGWESALGKPFSPFGKKGALNIAGVVKDYNFRSLHHQVEPCVLVIRSEKDYSQLAVKVEEANMASTLAEMEDVFESVLPEMQFEYSFMDDSFAQLYAAEQRTSKIVAALTIVAIVLATLGLYALLSFTLKEKTRELAIRKVLGVKTNQVMWLLTRNYMLVFGFASLIAVPVTFTMMNNWLDNFGYRIDLNLMTFFMTIGGILTLLLGIAIIKTFHSGRINPTDALRHD